MILTHLKGLQSLFAPATDTVNDQLNRLDQINCGLVPTISDSITGQKLSRLCRLSLHMRTRTQR